MLFRRKNRPSPPGLEEFLQAAAAAEEAQRALLAAIPSFRSNGVPLAICLANFYEHLTKAEAALELFAKKNPEIAASLKRSLQKARQQADHLRTTPAELPFEALNEEIGNVLYYLEDFHNAEKHLRSGEEFRPAQEEPS